TRKLLRDSSLTPSLLIDARAASRCKVGASVDLGLRQQTVAVAGADVVLLHSGTHQLHADRSPAPIGIVLRIVAHRIQVAQIILDGRKSLLLLAPVPGK